MKTGLLRRFDDRIYRKLMILFFAHIKIHMNQPPIKFYLFGDSICFGQLVNAYKTWAFNLAVELAEIKEYITCSSECRCKRQHDKTDLRMHYGVTSHRPDFIMIQFGMNDCNLMTIRLLSPTSRIVDRSVASAHCFLNTNHPSRKGGFSHYSDLTYDESNERYNQSFGMFTSA